MIAVIVPFYKRTELTKLCFKHLAAQKKKFGFSVFVSGDDKSIVPSEFTFVDCDNNPLGLKLNTLLKATKDFDGAVVIGSDDFLSDSIWKHYQTLDFNALNYYGFNDLHTYSVWHDKLGYDCAYTKAGHTIGVGRLWTKATLERMNYTLWTNDRNSGLDSDSKRRMISKGIKEVSMSYDGHFMVDVKQDYNITSPDIIKTCSKFDDVNVIVSELGPIGKEILSLTTGTTRQIKRSANKPIEKIVSCEVLKDFHGYLKGDIVNYKETMAKKAKKIGLIKIIKQ